MNTEHDLNKFYELKQIIEIGFDVDTIKRKDEFKADILNKIICESNETVDFKIGSIKVHCNDIYISSSQKIERQCFPSMFSLYEVLLETAKTSLEMKEDIIILDESYLWVLMLRYLLPSFKIQIYCKLN